MSSRVFSDANRILSVGTSNKTGIMANFDFNGNMLWRKAYLLVNGQPCNLQSLAPCPNGDIIAIGEIQGTNVSRLVLRLTSAGTVVWGKIYQAESTRAGFTDIVAAGNDEYLVQGWAAGDDVEVIKLDGQGNILAAKLIGNGADDHLSKVVPYGNGGCLITGGTNAASEWDGFVAALDNQLNFIWKKVVGVDSNIEDIGDMIEAPAGSGQFIAVASNHDRIHNFHGTAIIQFNPALSTQSVTTFDVVPSLSEPNWGYLKKINGDYYYNGYSWNGGGSVPDHYYVKFDAGLGLQWIKQFDFSAAGFDKAPLALHALAPGKLLAAGTLANTTNSAVYQAFLGKFDYDLNSCITTSRNLPSVISMQWNCRDWQTDIRDLNVTVQIAQVKEDEICITKRMIIPEMPTIIVSNNPVCKGDSLTLTATGSTTVYEWTLPDGSVQQASQISIASASAVHAGTYSVKAVGDLCTSPVAVTTITVEDCPSYIIPDLTISCKQDTVCIPLRALKPVHAGILGLDYCLNYNAAVMTPTGRYTVGSVATNGGSPIVNIFNGTTGQSVVSISYDIDQSYLVGQGDVIRLEFVLTPGIGMGSYSFSSCGAIETYNPAFNPVIDVTASVVPGVLQVEADRTLQGKLIYQSNTANPVINSGSPLAEIFQADASCDLSSSATPDQNGVFSMSMAPANSKVAVTRTIPAGTNVMNVINSADANLARSMVFNRHTANIYELIAADVNGSGMITSGDVGLILQRSTAQISHFPGLPDWKFVDDVLLATTPFTTATKNTVPQVPKCLALQKVTVNGCESFKEKVLQGILIGDVTGNWTAAEAPNARTESAGEIIIDLSKAVALSENRYRVPVFCKSAEKVEAVDFELAYEKTLQVKAVQKVQGDEMQWNGSEDKLLLSAIHPGGTVADEPLYYLEVSASSVESLRFEATAGYLNGKAAEVSIKKSAAPIGKLMVYPNPVSGNSFRIASPNVKLISCEVIDCTGRSVWRQSLDAAAGVYEVAPEHLSKGTYFIKAVDAEGNVHHLKFTSL